jgi:hypothetical protein
MQTANMDDMYFAFFTIAIGLVWIAGAHFNENRRSPEEEARAKERRAAFEARLRDFYHVRMRISHALLHYNLHPTDEKTLVTLSNALMTIEIQLRRSGPHFFDSEDPAVNPARILAEFEDCITRILERPSLKLVKNNKEAV